MVERYTQSLINLLGVDNLVLPLGNTFEEFYLDRATLDSPVGQLRRIKCFIYDGKERYSPLIRGTRLDSTDCLTLAVLANILASENGLYTRIAYPRSIKFLHSVLSFKDSRDQDHIFKLSGRNRIYFPEDCTILSPAQVDRRLKYFRPTVNFFNSLRSKPRKTSHYYSNRALSI